MIYFAYLLFAMLMLRFLVVLINFFSAPILRKRGQSKNSPKISVLIPARNEEKNLPHLLSDLLKIDDPTLEIIVCDDHSDDNTKSILQSFQPKFNHFSYFTKNNLPKGWVGKNHACHTLAQKANGDYFLFLDADVRLAPTAIKVATQEIVSKKLALLSIFPTQIMESKAEKNTVPWMMTILLSFLPLPFVQIKYFASLAAANGQFMFFNAKDYRQFEWHKMVYNKHVEDILIARLIKKKHLKIKTLLGADQIFCRMYQNGNEAVQGFARNIHQYFGGSRFWMLFYYYLLFIRIPFFLITQQYYLFVIAIVVTIFMKIMIAKMANFQISSFLFQHFNQLFTLTKIVTKNLQSQRSKSIEWKGRTYQPKE